MIKKAILGLGVLCAAVEGVAPGAVPGGLLPIALILVGFAWGFLAVDAKDPTTFCALVVAIGMTGSSDAMENLPLIGVYLDGVIDSFALILYAGTAALIATRLTMRMKEE